MAYMHGAGVSAAQPALSACCMTLQGASACMRLHVAWRCGACMLAARASLRTGKRRSSHQPRARGWRGAGCGAASGSRKRRRTRRAARSSRRRAPAGTLPRRRGGPEPPLPLAAARRWVPRPASAAWRRSAPAPAPLSRPPGHQASGVRRRLLGASARARGPGCRLSTDATAAASSTGRARLCARLRRRRLLLRPAARLLSVPAPTIHRIEL